MTVSGPADPPAETGVAARLADLGVVGGEALVRRILQRFEQHLADALAEGPPAWTPAFAHRTAGLAGMIGFERLAAACRGIELGARGDGPPVPAALAAAEDAVSGVRERLRRLG